MGIQKLETRNRGNFMRKFVCILLSVFCILFISGCATQQYKPANQNTMSKKVLFIIASRDFQIIEYETPKAVLEKAGIGVVIVSDVKGEAVASSGKKVAVDLLVSEVNVENYDGLFVIGGQGALGHLDNQTTYDLLKKWQTTGKPYGAICISPRILAHAGVLQGKKATGWNGDGELAGILSAGGAEFVDESVVVDGNIVTGNGPSAAGEWGSEIVRLLTKT